MFLGHYALAFGAKRVAPSVSLGTLFLAAQFADLLWPTLLAAGVERVEIEPGNTLMTPLNFVSYPYSHSLVMLVVWSIVFASVYRLARPSGTAALTALGALVFSHFILDVITHRPDMPLTINSDQKIGLGLWNHPGTTLALESAMYIGGALIYTMVTRARDRVGRLGLWSLIGVMTAIYFANLYGPPPPNTQAIAIAGHLQWLFVAWAYWIDRHRVSEMQPRRTPRTQR